MLRIFSCSVCSSLFLLAFDWSGSALRFDSIVCTQKSILLFVFSMFPFRQSVPIILQFVESRNDFGTFLCLFCVLWLVLVARQMKTKRTSTENIHKNCYFIFVFLPIFIPLRTTSRSRSLAPRRDFHFFLCRTKFFYFFFWRKLIANMKIYAEKNKKNKKRTIKWICRCVRVTHKQNTRKKDLRNNCKQVVVVCVADLPIVCFFFFFSFSLLNSNLISDNRRSIRQRQR